MWRYKDTDPFLIPYRDIIQANYNDNQLYCGGRDVSSVNRSGLLRKHLITSFDTLHISIKQRHTVITLIFSNCPTV